MIKLWEKSSIVKIALKRGVQLTTSERMAEEIKVINHAWSTFPKLGNYVISLISSSTPEMLSFWAQKHF